MERVREAAQLGGDGTATSGDPGVQTPISWPLGQLCAQKGQVCIP